jgi:phosphoribosylformylglycinamidine synthase subunit PurL
MESSDFAVGMKLSGEGQLTLLSYPVDVGPQQGLGASDYLAEVHGIENGCPVAPDLAMERNLNLCLPALAAEGLVTAMHDVSEGGVLFSLAEMAIGEGITVRFDLPDGGPTRTDAKLFGEWPGRVWVAHPAQHAQKVREIAGRFGLQANQCGTYERGPAILVGTQIQLDLEELQLAFESTIPQTMG